MNYDKRNGKKKKEECAKRSNKKMVTVHTVLHSDLGD
jgi:hypothetical protein